MRVGEREVAVTNLEKVFFPACGLTKGDLIQYYADIAPYALNHVERRPMQMKRHPNGVDGDFFYQKRVPKPPSYAKTSGVSGMHILTPIVIELPFPEVRRFAKAVAVEVASRVPKIATTTWVVKDRTGVFVDYGQNAFDRTIASAYSIRPM